MPYKDKEQLKAYRVAYHLKNKKKLNATTRKWKADNAKRHREYTNKRQRSDEYRADRRLHHDKNKQFVDSVKQKYGCQNPACQSPKSLAPCCLDFHHLDKNTKKFDVGCATTRRRQAILEEMNKCTILCAICHRLVTHKIIDASHFTKVDIKQETPDLAGVSVSRLHITATLD